MKARGSWRRIATFTCATALCGCGSSSSGSSDDPPRIDAGSNFNGGTAAPSFVDAAQIFATDGAPAPLGCTGARLDQNSADSCPDLAGSGPTCTCFGYAPDAGLLFSDASESVFDISSYLLPLPMASGQPYAFSVVVSDTGFHGDIEIWGTNATCGPGLERLYAAPLASQTYCANVVPSQDYSYVMLVQRLTFDSGAPAPAAEAASQFMACPTDRCP